LTLLLPYAGGNASIFNKWPDSFGVDVEVCAISLPGRWQRLNEPSVAIMGTLTLEIADAVRAESKTPLFFGHSMGAILSFEVGRQLRKQGAMLPDHLFVSGAQAPHTDHR
jgi:medium-chain acyl-[acyl-carrier-protein] hydrolase